jgi:hypothetical protein
VKAFSKCENTVDVSEVTTPSTYLSDRTHKGHACVTSKWLKGFSTKFLRTMCASWPYHYLSAVNYVMIL